MKDSCVSRRDDDPERSVASLRAATDSGGARRCLQRSRSGLAGAGAVIGRRCWPWPWLCPACAPCTCLAPPVASGHRRAPALAGQFHLAAFPQAIRAAGDNHLARLQAVGHGDALAFGRTGLDVAHRNRVVRLHDVDEQAFRAALERGSRDDGGVVQYVEQQMDVDELVGKQAFVIVDEFGFRLDRTGDWYRSGCRDSPAHRWRAWSCRRDRMRRPAGCRQHASSSALSADCLREW